MILVLRHIKTISVVEVKLLMRSFAVRFMWLLFLLITAFFVFFSHIGARFNPLVPGVLATKAYFFFSLTRLILSSFIAPVFVYNDQKQDTFHSIYPRSYSNTSYTFGKLIGFTGVMLIMDYFFMLTLFVSSSLLPGMDISIWPYLLYPLIITFPLCVFLFGVNVCVARIYYLLVYFVPILMIMFFFPLEDLDSLRVFDLGAITMPLAYSTITGFHDLTITILQRVPFVLIGIGLVLASNLLMQSVRKSGALRERIITTGSIGLMAVLTVVSVIFNNEFLNDLTRQRISATYYDTPATPSLDIASCDLTVIHSGKTLDVTSRMRITNPHDEPLSEIKLKHNMEFTTHDVTSEPNRIEQFNNDHGAITITLSESLQPNESITLEIHESGSLSRFGGYFHASQDILNRVHRTDLTVLGKQYAFLEPDYVLLPPEVDWYPTSYTGYDISEPGYLQRDLTEFTLTVTTGDGMVPISQGKMTELGENTFWFEPEFPLTQISLTIGQYQSTSIHIDGIEYSYHWIGKNPFDGFEFESNPVEKAIRSMKAGIEHTLQRDYPFKRFRVVETPIHYFGYQSPYAVSGPYEQPEIRFVTEATDNMQRYTDGPSVVITELTLLQRVFPQLDKNTLNTSGIMAKLNPPPSIYLLNRLRQYMVDPFEDYSHLLTQYSVFSRGPVSTDDYFNIIAVHWLRTQFIIHESSYNVMGDYRNLDTAALQFLSSKSLVDILGNDKYQVEYMDILTTASETFFILLAAKSGVDLISLEAALLRGFVSRGTDIAADLSELCELDVLALFEEFAQQSGYTHYMIADQTLALHVIDERSLYNIRFRVSNPTPYHGLVKTQINVYPDLQDMEVVYMEPFSEKEVGLISEKDMTDFTVHWSPFKNSVFETYYVRQPGPGADIPIIVKHEEPDQIAFFDGVRDVRRGTVPPVVVMDNLDEGCRVVSSKEKNIVQRFIEKRRADSQYLKLLNTYFMQEAPDEWSLLRGSFDRINNPFYGKFGCCYCIAAGDGQSAVEYTVSIPETGDYAVYLSAPAGNKVQGDIRMMFDSGEFGETTVKIHAADGVHEQVVDICASHGIEEWVYVGTYTFASTTALIQITDKTSAEYVIADAVQLRKVESQVSQRLP